MDRGAQINAEAGPSTPIVYPTAPIYDFAQELKYVTTVSAGTFAWMSFWLTLKVYGWN
jgi:hypothetical protein